MILHYAQWVTIASQLTLHVRQCDHMWFAHNGTLATWALFAAQWADCPNSQIAPFTVTTKIIIISPTQRSHLATQWSRLIDSPPGRWASLTLRSDIHLENRGHWAHLSLRYTLGTSVPKIHTGHICPLYTNWAHLSLIYKLGTSVPQIHICPSDTHWAHLSL